MRSLSLLLLGAVILMACNDSPKQPVQSTEKIAYQQIVYDTLNGYVDSSHLQPTERYRNFSLPGITLDKEVMQDTSGQPVLLDPFENFGKVRQGSQPGEIVIERAQPVRNDPFASFGTGNRITLNRDNLTQHSEIARAIYAVSGAGATAGIDAEAASVIRESITWLFDRAGNGPPAKLAVWGHMVPLPTGTKVPRGWLGARTCGNFGVLNALVGERDHALQWLQAAQAHNPPIMELFARYPDYTINYAVKNYGQRAVLESSIPLIGQLQAIRDVLRGLNGHNPPPRPPQETPEPPGRS